MTNIPRCKFPVTPGTYICRRRLMPPDQPELIQIRSQGTNELWYFGAISTIPLAKIEEGSQFWGPINLERPLQKGDLVRMTEGLKRDIAYSQHVAEFGECTGIVQGPTDYNNCKPGDPDYDQAKVGPELDVRWQPSNLRYAYDPSDLERVE